MFPLPQLDEGRGCEVQSFFHIRSSLLRRSISASTLPLVSAKEAAALDAGAKEEIGRFRLEEGFGGIASLGVQLGAFARDGEVTPGASS
jgi:hypothetical protein